MVGETGGTGNVQRAAQIQVAVNERAVADRAEAEFRIAPVFPVKLLLTVSVPTGFPGGKIPPLLMLTGPPMMPLPLREPPLATVTGPVPTPLPVTLFTSKVPLLTVVPPL